MARTAPVITALLALAAFAGCKDKVKHIDGIENWHLSKTKMSEAQGRCTPQKDGTTWCSFQPKLALAGQTADVDLYFDGSTDDSLLIEILLSIRRCQPDPLEQLFTQQLGPPTAARNTTWVWTGKAAIVVAKLPVRADECEISFVDPKDEKRIKILTKGVADPGASEPPPAGGSAEPPASQ